MESLDESRIIQTSEEQRLEANIERVAEFFERNDQSDKQSSGSSDSGDDNKDVCWICLEEETEDQCLVAPCKCPRKAHPKCLARWQLQSAGSKEETHCRFCNHELPNWRGALTPQAKATKSPLVVTVCSNGQEHDICVDNSEGDGLGNFQDHIRDLFGIQQNVQLKFTFYCTEPTSGDLITLEGAGAYNAAMHCASVSASKRGGSGRRGKSGHGRTASSIAAIGSEPVYRPSGHTRSRSAGSGSASDDQDDIPAHMLDPEDNVNNQMDSDIDFSVPPPEMMDEDMYSQMPLKRRLRALGKRMMRSLRITNPSVPSVAPSQLP